MTRCLSRAGSLAAAASLAVALGGEAYGRAIRYTLNIVR